MTFKTREEFFLAKMAGYDVDISTLTPPVPVNATERLMLEIAEKGAPSQSSSTNGSMAALPPISNNDDGKLLGVVNGEWGKVDQNKTFIDVISLPEDNIREDIIYKLVYGKIAIDGYISPEGYIVFVEELPEFGTPISKFFGDPSPLTMHINVGYYNINDGRTYGYIDNTVCQVLESIDISLSPGWYDTDVILGAMGMGEYGGIVTNLSETIENESGANNWEGPTQYWVLRTYGLFYYRDGQWQEISNVGTHGDNIGAEVFNSDTNVAYGPYSHAEGFGNYAIGSYQHVSGMYNLPDYSPLEIIGNGSDEDHRSNARTLDEAGNEWLAGCLSLGGNIYANDGEVSCNAIILTAPNGEHYTLSVDNEGKIIVSI